MLYTKLTELQEKLDKLCEDNDLEYSFNKENFLYFTFGNGGKSCTDEGRI